MKRLYVFCDANPCVLVHKYRFFLPGQPEGRTERVDPKSRHLSTILHSIISSKTVIFTIKAARISISRVLIVRSPVQNPAEILAIPHYKWFCCRHFGVISEIMLITTLTFKISEHHIRSVRSKYWRCSCIPLVLPILEGSTAVL